MKKSTLMTILLVICIAAAAVTGILLLGGEMRTVYADAGRYSAGETTLDAGAENLEIDWIDGKVTVAYHPENTITITETAPGAIPEDKAVHWWMDGNTLRIRYAKSGIILLRGLNKELTVTLPEGTKLKTARITGTSCDLEVPAITAEELEMQTTSGGIHAGASAKKVSLGGTSGNIFGTLDGAEEITAGTTSGSISLIQTGTSRAVRLSSTSGALSIKAEEIGELNAGSTSGSINVEAKKADKTDISSTSGSITLALEAFSDLKVGTTSGSVNAALPETPGFTGDFGTTSGRFDSALALTRNGSVYSCGDGSGRCTIHTTSGNIILGK